MLKTMSHIEIQVIDALRHEQDSLRRQFLKNQKQALADSLYVLRQFINTIANQGANKNGNCYGCGKQIDSGKVAVYRSLRNETVSFFHESCWLNLPGVAGSGKPLIVQVYES